MHKGARIAFLLALPLALFSIGATKAFAQETSLTLAVKVVEDLPSVNPSNWLLFAAYNDGSQLTVVMNGVFSSTTQSVVPGNYLVVVSEENTPLGYAFDGWECTGFTNGGSSVGDAAFDHAEDVTINDGEQVVCTVTFKDVSSPHLRLIKKVVGGTATSSDWHLSAHTTSGSGDFTDTGDSNAFHTVRLNSVYAVSESGPAGYSQTGFNCDGNPADRAVGSSTVQILQPSVQITCTVTNTAVSTTPDPVIIIPGILGSWEKNGQWYIDPVQHTYDNLIDTLLANGYVEGKTLFKFPYDWRSSNITTAFLLKNKIQEVKQICGCNKVDIIAHSMGGLVASAYIERDDYQNDIDQLFLVATPLEGSPFAYKTWEGADIDFGDPIKNLIMQMIFRNDARRNGYGIFPKSIYNYIHGWPIISIQELLPVNKNYLFTSTTTLQYPHGYPVNNFLENLDSSFKTKVVDRVNLKIIEADDNNFDTLNGIIVKPSTKIPLWENGEPVNNILGSGDGTVPSWGIEDVSSSSIKLFGTGHNLAASSSIDYVFKELTGRTPSPLIGTIYAHPALSLISFWVFSPIDIEIIAPDGKRLGKDFNTNSEIDEIPNAFYSGFETDNEYAVIVDPLPGTYTIKTIGTDNGGHYTIAGDYIDVQGDVSAETSGTTTPGQIIEHTFNLSTSDRTLKIPYRWDGFLQPINDTGHQINSKTSVFKAGSTVPVKFQLKNSSGIVVQASTTPIWLAPQKGGSMSAPVDEGVFTDLGTSGTSFKWDPSLQGYTYNWSTKGLAGGFWYKISIKLDDGTTQWAYVGLR